MSFPADTARAGMAPWLCRGTKGPVSLWGQDSGRRACSPLGRAATAPPVGSAACSSSGMHHGPGTAALSPGHPRAGLGGSSGPQQTHSRAGGAGGFRGPLSSRALCFGWRGRGCGPRVPMQPLHSTPEELQPEWPAMDLLQVAGAWALPHEPGVRPWRPSAQHGQPCPPRGTHSNSPQGPMRGGQPEAPACAASAKAGRQPHCGERHALPEKKRGQGARPPAPPLPPAFPGLLDPGARS